VYHYYGFDRKTLEKKSRKKSVGSIFGQKSAQHQLRLAEKGRVPLCFSDHLIN